MKKPKMDRFKCKCCGKTYYKVRCGFDTFKEYVTCSRCGVIQYPLGKLEFGHHVVLKYYGLELSKGVIK